MSKPKTLSHSKLTCFNSCPRKYKLKYIDGYEKRVKSNALRFGSLFHDAIAKLYESGSLSDALVHLDKEFKGVDKAFFSQKDHDDQDWTETVLPVVIKNWDRVFHTKDIESNALICDIERKFTDLQIQWPESDKIVHDIKWNFIADMVIQLGREFWLVEYKTASRIDCNYLDRLEIDNQISSYLFFLQKIYGVKFSGVIYRIFKKPTIRQKKGEGRTQFYDRLDALISQESDKYFIEHKVYRSEEDMKEFQKDLWHHSMNIANAHEHNAFPRNTASCVGFGACEYLPLCTKKGEIEQIYTKGERE